MEPRIGLDGYQPGTLRHFAATGRLEEGVDVGALAELARLDHLCYQRKKRRCYWVFTGFGSGFLAIHHVQLNFIGFHPNNTRVLLGFDWFYKVLRGLNRLFNSL